jgi:hypothetical protein
VVKEIIMRKLVIVAKNVPHDTTPQQVSELLWQRVGLHADPAGISVQNSGQFSATAFISFHEADLAEFLTRNFEGLELGGGTRGSIKFETKIWKEEQNIPRQQPRYKNYKVNVDQITIKLP